MSRCNQIWNRTIRTWNFNVLKSADFRCLVLQRRSGNLLFFASQVFIILIPNPKHQRLSWSNFCMDLANDKSSWTVLCLLGFRFTTITKLLIFHVDFSPFIGCKIIKGVKSLKCIFTPFLSLCRTVGQPYRLRQINAFCINLS